MRLCCLVTHLSVKFKYQNWPVIFLESKKGQTLEVEPSQELLGLLPIALFRHRCFVYHNFLFTLDR